MTKPDDSDIPRDDVIAAEYVLGVLSADDRRQVEKRMRSEDAFAQNIRQWEAHLSGLNEEYKPVPPNAATYPAIETRLFTSEVKPGFLPSLWGSLAFWRGFSALTTACAAIAAITFVMLPQPQPKSLQMSYMAELSSPDDPMALMVSYDASSGRMALTPMAAGDKAQKSLELWLVKADGVPISLGLVDPQKNAEMTIPLDMREQLHDGITLAVSLEPYGGSPTGKPTGPVIASGTTRQL
ncbi:putative anti-sigmaE protein [Agrobacterium sp. DSM 25558]|uniref:anti-sigma factor n=1 Tax=Agrobacterium sp. DSM 25558 TaxID=1907665 RepID=UPI0009724993|nr:anti-sigma factor [Agrobacterium sp. DSM 25558]SCX17705.1 putative anti-sigmaE protein [Agrobacterium sp. DSM 25558]